MTETPQTPVTSGSQTTVVEKRVRSTVIRRRAQPVAAPPAEAAPPAVVEAAAPVEVVSHEVQAPIAATSPAAPTTEQPTEAVMDEPVTAGSAVTAKTVATQTATTVRTVTAASKPGVRTHVVTEGRFAGSRLKIIAQPPPIVYQPRLTPVSAQPQPGTTTGTAVPTLAKPMRKKKSKAEWEHEDIAKAGGLLRYAEENDAVAVDEDGVPIEVVAGEGGEVTAPAAIRAPVAVERVFRPSGRRKKPLRRDFKKTQLTELKASKRILRIEERISVSDLSQAMGVKGKQLIRQLADLGVTAKLNDVVEVDTASLLAAEYGYQVEVTAVREDSLLHVAPVAAAPTDETSAEAAKVAKPGIARPPVVTVMGHVDHGKTSLLDAIRATNIAGGEAGGITQHIGASEIVTPKGTITFLDTPGHEAFTALRARGAKVTDLVVLVVAADDGVMPQTAEAIHHAKAAGVPLIVAINKMDKPDANPDRVKRELSEHGVVADDWGGDAIIVGTSAKSREGIDQLLDMILLQAEVLELRADPKAQAQGVVIEARLDRGRGPMVSVVVQQGTLKRGDTVVCGTAMGRVRALMNPLGQTIDAVGPGQAAEIFGLDSVPVAGDPFLVASNEKAAREVVEQRTRKLRESQLAKTSKLTLEDFHKQQGDSDVKILPVVIKADVQGSLEAVVASLNKLSTETVKVKVLHHAVGGITESDVLLAAASKAVVIGFNVAAESSARKTATTSQVDIKTYAIIYELIDEVKKAMVGLLEPTRIEKFLGRAEVRQTFQVAKLGLIAGCMVIEGTIQRGVKAKLLRDSVVVFEGKFSSLKRFKDDAKEVTSGMECGIGLDGFHDIKPGDVIEALTVEEVAATL